MARIALALTLALLPLTADAAARRPSVRTHLAAPRTTVLPLRHAQRARAPTAPSRRQLHRQTAAPHVIHVHDGDTFYVGAQTIRLRGIDTPELGQPKAAEATRRLIALLHSGPVTIVRRAEDRYGRIVADVYVGGRDVARTLRAEGFAKPNPRWPRAM